MSAKIAAALHEVMTKVAYVQKTGKNTFHNYKYAGESDLLDKLRPAMIEAGLLLLPSGRSITPVDDHGNVTISVEYTLAHKDGDVWPEKLVAFGAGNDRAKNGACGDKGVYKALTGANKYLLFKLFQIETGDDPEQDDREPERDERPARRPTESRPAPVDRQRASTTTSGLAQLRTALAADYSGEDAEALAYLAKSREVMAKIISKTELRDWYEAESDRRLEHLTAQGRRLFEAEVTARAKTLPESHMEAAE